MLYNELQNRTKTLSETTRGRHIIPPYSWKYGGILRGFCLLGKLAHMEVFDVAATENDELVRFIAWGDVLWYSPVLSPKRAHCSHSMKWRIWILKRAQDLLPIQGRPFFYV